MKSQTPTFFDLLLGEMNYHEWLFSLLLIGIGATIYILLKIRNRRDQKTKPSINYWIRDFNNVLSLFISVLLSYVLIRFYSEYKDLLQSNMPEGLQVTQYFAMLVVGFYQHKISIILGKKALKL